MPKERKQAAQQVEPTPIPSVVLEKSMFRCGMPWIGIFEYEGKVYETWGQVRMGTPSWSALEEISKQGKHEILISDHRPDDCGASGFVPCDKDMMTLSLKIDLEDREYSKFWQLFEDTRYTFAPADKVQKFS